jgi:hypothetical protein
LECFICHEFYQEEAFLGIPAATVCASCHLEPQGDSRAERDLVRLLKESAPLDGSPCFDNLRTFITPNSRT